MRDGDDDPHLGLYKSDIGHAIAELGAKSERNIAEVGNSFKRNRSMKQNATRAITYIK